MSYRRQRNRRRHHRHSDGDGLPRPPQKTIRCRGGRHKKRVNTEVHDAVWSLGKNDRTAKLSDREFNGQVAREIGYMFRLSGSHFRNACSALSDLFHALF